MRNYPVDDRTIWKAPKGAIFFCRFAACLVARPALVPVTVLVGCCCAAAAAHSRGFWEGLAGGGQLLLAGSFLFSTEHRVWFNLSALKAANLLLLLKTVMPKKRLGVRHQGFPSHH